jgi:hypothetical protein
MSAEQSTNCSYMRTDGSTCPGTIEDDGELCFWHDREVSKENVDLRDKLQAWARSGESMEGFVLRYANLEGLRIYDEQGLDLSNSVLFRARLRGASLWRVNLRGADMMKADLTGANLNEARLENADLLGEVLDGTKLERTRWGDRTVQETAADAAAAEGDAERARVSHLEAEEVYRGLRRAYDGAGRSDDAGYFFRKEMTMRRMIMPFWSARRIWSKLVDLFCGYGEQPQRVIGFSLLLIAACAALFFVLGVRAPEGVIGYDSAHGLAANAGDLLDCAYFSFVTFTTLGYGDITPRGLARPVAALEAFSGAFMMALFVAVFGKKMTR